MTTYDFNDSSIRDMVYRNHKPKEYYERAYGGLSLSSIRCTQCEEEWKCSAIREYDIWVKEYLQNDNG